MTRPAAPVVGVDLSLSCTGMVHVTFRGINPGSCEIRTSKHGIDKVDGGVTKLPAGERVDALQAYANRLARAVLGDRPPRLVAIESPTVGTHSSGGLFERGFVLYETCQQVRSVRSWIPVPLLFLAPSTIKMYVTGKGNASKNEVVDGIARRFPMFETGGNPDLCDAAGAAAIGCHLLGEPLVELPKTHTRALDPLTLPEGAA